MKKRKLIFRTIGLGVIGASIGITIAIYERMIRNCRNECEKHTHKKNKPIYGVDYW